MHRHQFHPIRWLQDNLYQWGSIIGLLAFVVVWTIGCPHIFGAK